MMNRSVVDIVKLVLLTNFSASNDWEDPSRLKDYLSFIKKCYQAGITSLQIREKVMTNDEILDFIFAIRATIQDASFPIFINDNASLAQSAQSSSCSYLHLGQSDGDVLAAKKILGNKSVIGLSIESLSELEVSNSQKIASYHAASSVFLSDNKNNQKTIWGIDGLKMFCKKSKLPVVAIGGITLENLGAVIDTGVNGVAIISAIHDSAKPKETIKEIINIINKYDRSCERNSYTN